MVPSGPSPTYSRPHPVLTAPLPQIQCCKYKDSEHLVGTFDFRVMLALALSTLTLVLTGHVLTHGRRSEHKCTWEVLADSVEGGELLRPTYQNIVSGNDLCLDFAHVLIHTILSEELLQGSGSQYPTWR